MSCAYCWALKSVRGPGMLFRKGWLIVRGRLTRLFLVVAKCTIVGCAAENPSILKPRFCNCWLQRDRLQFVMLVMYYCYYYCSSSLLSFLCILTYCSCYNSGFLVLGEVRKNSSGFPAHIARVILKIPTPERRNEATMQPFAQSGV